eukprot:479379-Pyramimonas_sp.AAC.1
MPQRELRRLAVVPLLIPILYAPPPFRLDSLRGLPRDRPPVEASGGFAATARISLAAVSARRRGQRLNPCADR